MVYSRTGSSYTNVGRDIAKLISNMRKYLKIQYHLNWDSCSTIFASLYFKAHPPDALTNIKRKKIRVTETLPVNKSCFETKLKKKKIWGAS